MPEAGERIQKLMSEWGICSRRAAEKLIEEGRVKRNGRPVKLGEKAVSRDILTVDGVRIGPTTDRKIYIMLNKPRGYVTTAKDELGRKCVTDLVADVGSRLYPVGRLDRESEGLLLLTNDGAFAQKVSHPSYEVGKTYRVTVGGKITPETELSFLQGVESDGELLNVKRVEIVKEEESRTVLEIALTEGKNRHIRRICEALGLEIMRLKRVAEGGVKLGGLPVGKYRELTPQEVATLNNRK